MLIVLTTAPNITEAETLARKIIEAKLAGCVQILPQIVSYYYWENEIQKDSEYLLLIKTANIKYDELENFIQSNHCYEIPEITAVHSDKVSEKYSKWLNDYVGCDRNT